MQILPFLNLSCTLWVFTVLLLVAIYILFLSFFFFFQSFYKGDTTILANPLNSWKLIFPDTPLLIGGDYQLTINSQVLADLLLIFHFILVSISQDGNSARMILELLKGFMLVNSFVYKEVVFDLATDKQTLQYTY